MHRAARAQRGTTRVYCISGAIIAISTTRPQPPEPHQEQPAKAVISWRYDPSHAARDLVPSALSGLVRTSQRCSELAFETGLTRSRLSRRKNPSNSVIVSPQPGASTSTRANVPRRSTAGPS
eukprot:scaffold10121_cov112-Isochrysis_galbana.AAC.2